MDKFNKKERKVVLDILPRFGKNINWIESKGYKIPFIYDDIEGEIEIVDIYKNYLFIKFLDLPIFKIANASFSKCMLGTYLNKHTSDFKVEIGQAFKDDKRDLTILSREYKKDNRGRRWKKYKYKCNKCGFDCGEHYKKGEYRKELLIEESNIKTCGCACCANQIVVVGVNDIPTTAPWMMKYFQGGYEEAKLYNKTSGQKIYPICPDCGRVKDKEVVIGNIYRTNSIGCICSDGIKYPNKFMFNLLKQLQINFITEYSPKWIKPRAYDFYIPSMSLIIEMDGVWHNVDNKMSGQTKEESKAIDDYKDEMAREYNIKTIRINCDYRCANRFEYIKNNTINELESIFNLSHMNWNEINECSLSSKIIEVKSFLENKMSIKDICEKTNLGQTTIRRYKQKINDFNI